MTRVLITVVATFAMLLQGCADAAKERPLPDLRAFIATSGVASLMSPSPAPLPPQPPAPEPGKRECENCHGTGIVGDGPTSFTCAVCDGRGFVAGGSPVSPAGGRAAARSPARSAAPGSDQPTFRIVCEDGVCRRIQIAPPQR